MTNWEKEKKRQIELRASRRYQALDLACQLSSWIESGLLCRSMTLEEAITFLRNVDANVPPVR